MKRRTTRRFIAEINVVPYIDVMLVLLVIFMITAPLLHQGVEVDLPKVSAKPLSPDEQRPLVLSVDFRGTYYLNLTDNPLEPLNADQVLNTTAAALRANPERTVLVKADQTVNYGTVVQAMILLQRAGAPKVGLLTEVPEK